MDSKAYSQIKQMPTNPNDDASNQKLTNLNHVTIPAYIHGGTLTMFAGEGYQDGNQDLTRTAIAALYLPLPFKALKDLIVKGVF